MLLPAASTDESARLAVLESLHVLELPSDPSLDAVTALASRLTACPIALVTVIDADRQWIKSRVGTDARQTPRELTLCSRAIQGDSLFEVPDAMLDPRFVQHPMVTGGPRLRFYAGVPLVVDAQKIGTLCVLDQRPRQLDDAQRAVLEQLAQLVVDRLLVLRDQVDSATERERLSDFAVPVVDAQGDFRGWRGTARDITERVQAGVRAQRREEMLQHLLGEVPGVIYQCHSDMAQRLSFPYVSPDAKAQFGLEPDRVQQDASLFLNIVHPEDRAAFDASLEASRLQLLPWRFERFRFPDGRARVMEVMATGQYAPDGRPLGLIGISRDITAQAEAEGYQRDKESAERASLAKSEFLSRVSHELRTPLNGILGFAQLMALDYHHPLAPDQQRRLDGVQRAGHHLLELVNDVLDLMRIDRNDFELALTGIDLNVVLARCLERLRPLAAASQVRLPQGLPTLRCRVLSEARAIEQVLMNLLSNAVRYNRIGGAVHLHVMPSNGRMALTVVEPIDVARLLGTLAQLARAHQGLPAQAKK
jgi:PAS domain S-box-containing protein